MSEKSINQTPMHVEQLLSMLTCPAATGFTVPSMVELS